MARSSETLEGRAALRRRSLPPWRSLIRWVGAFLALGLVLAGIADRMFPPTAGRSLDPSRLVLAADGAILRAFAADDGRWRFPLAPAAVDRKLVDYLLAFEDRRFRWHPGIDPLAALRAGTQAIAAGKIVSGASTLTMQVARLLEPHPRSLGGKIREAVRALQLEYRYGKDEILGFYLMLAPYGGNLEGVRAASLAYFGKEPTRLTEAEAALLVALPQSPERLRPDRFPAAAKAGRDKVLARLHAAGLLDDAAYAAALAEPVPDRRHAVPSDAPHLAEKLTRDLPLATAIRSTIDRDLQLRLQDLAARHRRDFEPSATIAILAIRNSNRHVLAYIGAADYFDHRQFGPIDMVQATRSPGSTLKPFVYGMAFDSLIAHPATTMVDRPMRFGDYAPSNFDNRFHGEMSACDALRMSLNLPAVALLDALGPGAFADRLAKVGAPIDLPKDSGPPGLPIILGGAGISLERLVMLYAGLADEGQVRPLVYRADAALGEARAVMKPLGAYYVTQCLEGTPPPDNWLAASQLAHANPIAFKTGTSYGFRDAWAIGYNRDYTIGVWIGRPDGSYMPGRMGRGSAAPILFEIFAQLPVGASANADRRPAEALAIGNRELPANLRRFDPGPAIGALAEDAKALRIAFPVDGSTLPVAGLAALEVKATGGALPLRWLINGREIESQPYLRQAQWSLSGLGAQRITVIDAAGHSASAEIWLK